MIANSAACVLGDAALATVIACQRARGAQEICGLCVVEPDGTPHFFALTNHARDPDRFETAASEEWRVRHAVERRGWQIVAFVHTHLGGSTEMSARDARAFHRDTLPWIIVAFSGAGVRQRVFPRPGPPAPGHAEDDAPVNGGG